MTAVRMFQKDESRRVVPEVGTTLRYPAAERHCPGDDRQCRRHHRGCRSSSARAGSGALRANSGTPPAAGGGRWQLYPSRFGRGRGGLRRGLLWIVAGELETRRTRRARAQRRISGQRLPLRCRAGLLHLPGRTDLDSPDHAEPRVRSSHPHVSRAERSLPGVSTAQPVRPADRAPRLGAVDCAQ